MPDETERLTTGRAQLVRVLRALSRATVAATCAVNLSTVARWVSGKAEPSREARRRLERFTVDPAAPW